MTVPNSDSNSPNRDHAAGLGHSLRMLGRAARLRCPNCGGGSVLRNWLKLHERCPTCGIYFERGEKDFFIGSLLLNYCLTGLMLVVAIYVVLWWRSPEVPWALLQWGGAAAIVVLPAILFPFAKLLWLAVDLIFRPEGRRSS